MRVANIEVRETAEHCELHADVFFQTHWVWGDAPFHLWYQFPHAVREFLSAENGDPFLATFLAPAMALREPLEIAAPVSRSLARSVADVAAIYDAWHAELTPVSLHFPLRDDTAGPAGSARGAVGAFFSAGVDSSYTLLKNHRADRALVAPITHLLTVEGFDVYLWERQRFVPMLAAVRAVADAFGMQVVPVTTNLRELTDRVVSWTTVHHGAALAAVWLALPGLFSRVHLAASFTYRELHPWGSHPLVDPLFSTEQTSFVHDGCEARRIDKIRSLAGSPELLRNLRVCGTDQVTEAYNCGACEKCVRTMAALYCVGALGRCDSLPHALDLGRLRDLRLDHDYQRQFMREILDALGDSEAARAVKDAIRASIDRALEKRIPAPR